MDCKNGRNKKIASRSAGFTLVELLIVIVITVLLISVIFTGDRTRAVTFRLDDVAYRIALKVREVQSYGLSAREYSQAGGAGTRTFCAGYGVVFNITTPTVFHVFADFPLILTQFSCGNTHVAYNVTDPLLEEVVLRGARVTSLCAKRIGFAEVCGINQLSVGFQRPSPEPRVQGGSNYEFAKITVSTPDGLASRTIIVRASGQVSVE